jgi:hypothetical protein
MKKVLKKILECVVLIIAGILFLILSSIIIWFFLWVMSGPNAGSIWIIWASIVVFVLVDKLIPISEYSRHALAELNNNNNNKEKAQ